MDKSHLAPDGGYDHARGASVGRNSQQDVHEEFFSTHLPSRPASAMGVAMDAHPSQHKARKLVLCFDGTGNKFHGDDSDSNILKIFRMLDRTASDQYHYYQPGIGTYVVSKSLTHTGTKARIKSWYMKAKDSAIGSSFDQHVVGGYRFLMRFYSPGDEIYIFGFSRGSYIARFLAEMLDYVGLLSHGNEEMVAFAWKAFSSWQARRSSGTPEGIKKKKQMYDFMKGFRETFSRPVRRIRFLGLFDTVNSVPRFETAWMERSKFPYTARTSAKVIRHAVSIDERRAKFRQDLIYQSEQAKKTPAGDHNPAHLAHQKLHEIHEKYRRRSSNPALFNKPGDTPANNRGRPQNLAVPEDPVPYRARSRSTRSRVSHITDGSADGGGPHNIPPDAQSVHSIEPAPATDDGETADASSEDENDQDIDEVWFSGGHGDIGGGWEILEDTKSASHVPLAWMVREAMKAGLHFDDDKVIEMGCMDVLEEMAQMGQAPAGQSSGAPCGTQAPDPVPGIMVRTPSMSTPKMLNDPKFQEQFSEKKPDTHDASEKESKEENAKEERQLTFKEMMHKAHVALIHDSLMFDCGLGWSTVLAWKLMEYMPFRRMDLQGDGSWKPIRWPLPCGEVRDIPDNARVHGSVIRRMQQDENYRPGNLIIGGGGRGVRVAPKEYGIGDWVCVGEEGDPIGEVWMRRSAVEKSVANCNH
ncbi:hypothetical protein QBC46DRAFT_112348 [Diplogelasinospora grovesii]|uniref:T6SS Phospholipase effector Tle1-like catalytic domain-containing protein n=1 Tax=Diplogelasinospora grovesii TaxID=303347 RepID=A0AAN6N812_9PEZI|nr:hypothetical protein QBC46DRAFT_112348 [Diplogelasinospora grovesii]